MDGRLTLSVEEAAAELGICAKSVYALARREDFPIIKLGRRIRIPREGLREWVERHAENRKAI